MLTHHLLPHNQTTSAAHSHNTVYSPPCGHTHVAWLFHHASLQPQSSSLVWDIGVFSFPQLCQQGGKNGKSMDYNNGARESCGCLLPRKGWKLDFYHQSRGLQCPLSLCHCAAGHPTEETYAQSWWGFWADTLTRVPITQEAARLEVEPAVNSCSW